MFIKIVAVQTRRLKRVERFVFKSGVFDIGKLCMVCVDGIQRIVKPIIFEKKNVFSYPRTIGEGTFKKLNIKEFRRLDKIELEEEKIKEKISRITKKYRYPIKIISVEYSFDKKKVYAYFSSEDYIDLFILVKKISENLKILIEFKHVSRREVARFVGGIGVCGRGICCNSFLVDLKKVNAESASAQDLMTDSSKFTGLCGCLMCCLAYEERIYASLKKEMPEVDDVVNTPNGLGIVLGLNVVSSSVKVALIDSPNSAHLYFKLSEISKV